MTDVPYNGKLNARFGFVVSLPSPKTGLALSPNTHNRPFNCAEILRCAEIGAKNPLGMPREKKEGGEAIVLAFDFSGLI